MDRWEHSVLSSHESFLLHGRLLTRLFLATGTEARGSTALYAVYGTTIWYFGQGDGRERIPFGSQISVSIEQLNIVGQEQDERSSEDVVGKICYLLSGLISLRVE